MYLAVRFIFITIILFSCQNKSDIYNAFNQQKYQEIDALLNKFPDSWEIRLFKNKLAYETKSKIPYEIDSILPLFLNDKSFSFKEFQMIYYHFKLTPKLFIRDLIILEDSRKSIIKTEYFYTELLNLLISKNKDLRVWAKKKVETEFNYKQTYRFFKMIQEINNDSNISNTWKLELKNTASIFDYYEKESPYYNKKFNDGFSIKALDSLTFERVYYNSKDTIKLSDLNTLDIFLMNDKLLFKNYKRLLTNLNTAYKLVNANRTIKLNEIDLFLELSLNKLIPETYRSSLLRNIQFVSPDSLYKIINNETCSELVRGIVLEKIPKSLLTKNELNAYFISFKQATLQHELEQRIKSFSSDLVNEFLEAKIKKSINSERELIFAIYFIGKNGLTEQKLLITPFLKHSNRSISYEAEQSIARLNYIIK